MEDWDLDDEWDWDHEQEHDALLHEWCAGLADCFFLSDNSYLPCDRDDYSLGYLEAEDWWPLANQLDETVDLDAILALAGILDDLLQLPGLPTGLLESPLTFLESVLDGGLPLQPSGRRVGSPRLVKIALYVTRFLKEFPESAQAAVRAWANVHRQLAGSYAYAEEDEEEDDWTDLLHSPNLPPPITGFSMVIALTLMRWPDRAEGLPVPSDLLDRGLYDQVLSQWESLPDTPAVTEEGVGDAEALFAQGQLAHVLAQMGTVELLTSDDGGELEKDDLGLAYSRLSRAVLWIHNQCRRCSERNGVTCTVAANWPDSPVALVDVASEIANMGRIVGCVKM
jgi:hypothetical protein